MPIKNLTLGACLLLAGTALAQNHHNTITHKVRKGETLDKIAKWTGTTKQSLIAANHINGKLKPGQILTIPTSSSKPQVPHYNLALGGYAPYTIKSGDSDWKIANMFHMTPAELRKLNTQVNWKAAKPGTKIRIPMRNAFVYKLASIPVINSRYAVTLRDETIVRSAPGSNAKRVVKVDAGRHVKIIDRDEHWYKVKFEHGTIGWVRGDLLKAEQPKVVATRTVTRQTPKAAPAPKPRAVVASRVTTKPKSAPATKASRNSRLSRSGYAASVPTAGTDLLSYAQSFKGTPYRWGQSSRSGTDCSGFSLQVMKKEGIKLPRTAAQQSRKGQPVSKGQLSEGDLVFFRTSRGSRISHVGIYMGNGKFIHASSGKGRVRVDSLNDGYYKRRFATARRVVKVKKNVSSDEKIAQSQEADKKAMEKAVQSPTTPVEGN